MARINVEERIFKDKRFEKLMFKLGSREMALGALLEAWLLAQNYWKSNRRFIPKSVWSEQGMNNALIEVGLAVEMDTGIYVKGSKKHFDWLVTRKAAASKGGAASADSRRRDSDDLSPKQTQANASKRNPLPPPLPPPLDPTSHGDRGGRTSLSAARRQELHMSQEAEQLRKAFEGEGHRVNRYIPDILHNWGSLQNFSQWQEGIIKKHSKMVGPDKLPLKDFILVCIKTELGIHVPKGRQQ